MYKLYCYLLPLFRRDSIHWLKSYTHTKAQKLKAQVQFGFKKDKHNQWKYFLEVK